MSEKETQGMVQGPLYSKNIPDFSLNNLVIVGQRGRGGVVAHIYTSSTRKALTTTASLQPLALLPGLARPLSGSYKYFSPRFETSLSDSVTDESDLCVYSV